MGRKKTTLYVKSKDRNLAGKVLEHWESALAEGLTTIRRRSGAAKATYNQHRDAWVLSSGDWLVGLVTRRNVWLNLMDAEVKYFLPKGGTGIPNLTEMGAGLGTVWGCDRFDAFPERKFQDTDSIYENRLMSNAEAQLEGVLEETGLKLYTYAKLNDARVINAHLCMQRVDNDEAPMKVATSRSKNIFLLPGDNPVDMHEENITIILSRDMKPLLNSTGAYNIQVSLAAMQRLHECEDAQEFVGCLNTSILRSLNRETALARYEETKSIAHMTKLGIGFGESYNRFKGRYSVE